MSNVGQAALTIVGTVVGTYVGYPQLGFVLGSLAGNALFPTKLPGQFGPRLTDNRTTQAIVGSAVQEVLGTDGVAGQVIWMQIPAREVSTTESQGKGGPSQESTTFTYFQSIAIGLCRGPIGGILRIWENGKLVYDRRPQQPGESTETFEARFAVSVEYELGMVVYLGDEDQMPDPTIELDKGAGNVPAWRGLAYVVFPDRPLQQDQALRQPSYKFEVTNSPQTGDCEEITLYSNRVLHPWLGGGNANPRNENTFRVSDIGNHFAPGLDTAAWINGIAEEDTLAAARVYAGIGRGIELPISIGYQLGYNQFNSGLELVETGDPGYVEGGLYDPHFMYLHWNNFNPVNGLFRNGLAAPPPTPPIGSLLAQPGSLWWTGQETYFTTSVPNSTVPFPGGVFPPDYPLWTHGSRWDDYYWYYESRDTVIRITRNPGGPRDPCDDPDVLQPVPGYTLIEGKLVSCGPWTRRTEDNVDLWPNVLTIYNEANAGVQVQHPLGPCLPPGDPRDTPEFWEAAYEAALEDGDVPAGWTYGLQYPIHTQIWWERTALSCDPLTGGPVSLATVVRYICERCELFAIDVADLEDKFIWGYTIGRVMSGRDAIDPLRNAGFFDVVESGDVLKFVARGKATVADIQSTDLGATEGRAGDSPSVKTAKMDETQLPRIVRIHYRSPARDYEEGEQISPSRTTARAVNDLDVELPVALEDSAAAKIANVLWADAWEGRTTHEISLDSTYAGLEPADTVTIPVDGFRERVRIVSIEDSVPLLRRLSLCRDYDGSYVSQAIAEPPERTPGEIIIRSPTEILFLDLPALRPEDNDAGLYIALRPTTDGTWPGATLFRSPDGLAFTALFSVTDEPMVARLEAELEPGDTLGWDDENILTVQLLSGELESRTEADVLEGANLLAVGADGRWEMVQFTTVTQIDADTFELSHLLRGRRGTEHLMNGSQVDDKVVLMSGPGIVRMPLALELVDTEFSYKAPTIGTEAGSATSVTFTGHGQALVTFSAIDLAVNEVGSPAVLTLTWVRRDRLGQELQGGADPDSDVPHVFEIEVEQGGILLDTLTSSIESVDLVGYSGTITVRIYQLNATIGRGTPAEGTFNTDGTPVEETFEALAIESGEFLATEDGEYLATE